MPPAATYSVLTRTLAPYPCFIEPGVFDGAVAVRTVFVVIAVYDMEDSVGTLDQGGLVASGRLLTPRVKLELALKRPGFTFVGGEGRGQAVSASLRIVVDKKPVPVV